MIAVAKYARVFYLHRAVGNQRNPVRRDVRIGKRYNLRWILLATDNKSRKASHPNASETVWVPFSCNKISLFVYSVNSMADLLCRLRSTE